MYWEKFRDHEIIAYFGFYIIYIYILYNIYRSSPNVIIDSINIFGIKVKNNLIN